ncbi:MAG: hypothetical protein ABSG95_10780 [Solirubrobacteraceae bacterium]|jgi:hypothetical protein
MEYQLRAQLNSTFASTADPRELIQAEVSKQIGTILEQWRRTGAEARNRNSPDFWLKKETTHAGCDCF